MSQTAVVDFEEKVRKSYKVQLYLELWISKTQQQSLVHLLFSVRVQTTKNSPVICLGTYRYYQLAKNNRLVRKMLLTCNLISELVCQPQYELCTHSEERIDYVILEKKLNTYLLVSTFIQDICCISILLVITGSNNWCSRTRRKLALIGFRG